MKEEIFNETVSAEAAIIMTDVSIRAATIIAMIFFIFRTLLCKVKKAI